MQRFAAFCLRKNGAIIFTTVLLPFYYHEIAENSVNTVPFAAFCHAYLPPLFSRKSARNAKRGKSWQVKALNRSLPVVGYGVFEYRDL